MFEGSLVESRGLVASGTARWTAMGSTALQCLVAGILIAVPLLRPEGLPSISNAPQVMAPVPPKPVKLPVQTTTTTASSETFSAPATPAAPAAALRSILIGKDRQDVGPEPVFATGLHMGDGTPNEALATALTVGNGPAISVTRASPGTLHVSSGVSSGMLLAPIQPIYPAIAKAARIEGTVVLEAVISKAGRIESLHAVSGPPMLRGAALEAVQAARYKPYQLNGEPTEVQTTITVVFRLGS